MMDKKDLTQDKKTAAKAVHKHEKAMHPGKPMTKMRAGGKTNSDMLKMGRNLAKIANQKSPGRRGG
jgi:hypothetical protein